MSVPPSCHFGLVALLASPAGAQVPNGDFASGALAPGWTSASTSQGEAEVVQQGSSFSTATPTGGIVFSSPTDALLIRGGWVGMTLEEGIADSDPFTVTRGTLRFEQQSESALAVPRAFVLDDGGAVVTSAFMPASVGSFATTDIDVSSRCGLPVTVSLRGYTDNFGGGDSAFTLFDDVALVGAVCATFADGDGDGVCPTGQDLDGDGDCEDASEIAAALVDCDDADADRFPGNPEIAGDAVDQDCDGVDLPGDRRVSGTIHEDRGGDGAVDGDPGVPGVTVTVWRDGGDDIADGVDDGFVATVASVGGGGWTATGLGDTAVYWVTVDASTIRPLEGLRADADPDQVWAEQTYGSFGGLCADGLGGTAISTGGPCYAGRRADTSDAPDLAGAEHVVRVDVGGTDVSGIDLGFSFDVVTATGDTDAAPAARRWGQGTLRQFVLNANDTIGEHTMRFVPAGPAGMDPWWTVVLTTPLPPVTSDDTRVDGAAWCNGVSCPLGAIRDENPGTLSLAPTLGIGADQIPDSGDEVALAPWSLPELMIDGGDRFPIVLAGDVSLSGVSLVGSGVRIDGDLATVEDCLIGPTADGTVSTVGSLPGVRIDGDVDAVAVIHNLIQVGAVGIERSGTGDGATIASNAILAPPGGHDAAFAGVSLTVDPFDVSEGDRIEENLIEGVGGAALELGFGGGELVDLVIRDNTLRSNGYLDDGLPGPEAVGVVIRQVVDSDVRLSENLITDNAGPGVVVQASASGVTVVGNAFSRNAGPALDLDAGDADPRLFGAGDGVTPNDGLLFGDRANGGLDYPVLVGATVDSSGSLRVSGYVGLLAGPIGEVVDVDLYFADDDGDQFGEIELGDGASVGHGEPTTWLGSCVTDAAGAFDCTVSAGSVPVADGSALVATASSSSGTSEVGAVARVVADDADNDGLSDNDEINVFGSDPNDADTDNDLLLDGDEVFVHGTDPVLRDSDNDVLTDGEEVQFFGTDPTLFDTDGGGTDDGTEVILTNTDPLDPSDDAQITDTDGDGLPDADEVMIHNTDPFDADTDDDLLSDGLEITITLTNPLLKDTDGDLLDDGIEVLVENTDPLVADTDGGGVDDGSEVLIAGTDPLDGSDDSPTTLDSDGDGLSDVDETDIHSTDPFVPDTDGDTLSDGDEVLVHFTDPLLADMDGDTLSDGAEILTHGTDPVVLDTDMGGVDDGVEVNVDGTDPLDGSDDLLDSDGDGLLDTAEVAVYFTDPFLADTDGDDLDDGLEVGLHLTDPLEPDTDGDGLTDGEEIDDHLTDPLEEDSDGDGLLDGDEVDVYGTDPLSVDTDGDGLDDPDEIRVHFTNPLLVDTDGGTVGDGDEVAAGSDPLDPTDDVPVPDTDGDGLTDPEEIVIGTDPLVFDTDGDLLGDGEEVWVTLTNPTLADTDGDGLSDGDEVLVHDTDPLVADSDADGLVDGEEIALQTLPNEPDSDSDGLDDGDEVDAGTDPLDPDTDGGGVEDGEEVLRGTDPLDPTDDLPDTGLPVETGDTASTGPTGETAGTSTGDTDVPIRSTGTLGGGSGCACGSTGGTPLGLLWLLGFAAMGVRSRR